VNAVSRFFRWVGNPRAAAKLRRRARRTAEPAERVALLERAVALDDIPSARMELAVAAAQCGWLDEAAESWRRAVAMKPVIIPTTAELAALWPVLPLVARDLLRVMSGTGAKKPHWKLERRGSFGGEERWKVEQESAWTMDELMPTLRFLAQVIAHTAAAPGHVRFDCDRLDRGGDSSDEIVQMGEAIIRWDEQRRLDDTGIYVDRALTA
jgi:hypothetical protein